MEISRKKLAEIKEQSYLQGERRALLTQLYGVLKQMSYGEDMTRERLISEREEAILALRSICSEYGDNDWDEKLHMADIINKHLGRHLTDSKYHK